MAKETTCAQLCASCGSNDDVRAVRIVISGERGMTAHLCAFCRRPLRRVIEAVHESRKPRVCITALPVLTLDEVDRMTRGKDQPRRSPDVGPPQSP